MVNYQSLHCSLRKQLFTLLSLVRLDFLINIIPSGLLVLRIFMNQVFVIHFFIAQAGYKSFLNYMKAIFS